MATEALTKVRAELSKEWDDINLACKHAKRILLWGPPGTGKSFLGCNVKKEDLYRLYITMDTPAAEVRGHYLPNDNGGFTWHDGPGIAAWRNGGRLVIDEIDSASGDTLTLLMGLLDDPESAKLTLPTNETIYPKAGFSVVATTNQLPSVIPEALLDRFDVIMHVTKPSPEAFKKGWNNQRIAQAAENTILLNKGDVPRGKGNRPVGLRCFRAIDRLENENIPLDKAASLVMGEEASRWFSTAMKLSA